MLQDTIHKVSDLESKAVTQPAEPVDLEPDLNAVKQRLSELENDVKDVKAAVSAPLQKPAQEPAPAPAAAESIPVGSSVVMVAQPAEPADETRAEEWLRRARLLWNGQRFTNAAAAVDLLTKALNAAPANAEMFNERGLAQLDAGFPDRALSDFSRAIMLDAKLVSAFHNRGLLYMKMDNRDLACRDFRSAAALGDSRALKMAQETGYCGSSVLKKLFRGIID